MLRGHRLIVSAPSCRKQGGAFVMLNPGRSPEHQTKERQQQQDDKPSHAANPLYPLNGDLRRAERLEEAA